METTVLKNTIGKFYYTNECIDTFRNDYIFLSCDGREMACKLMGYKPELDRNKPIAVYASSELGPSKEWIFQVGNCTVRIHDSENLTRLLIINSNPKKRKATLRILEEAFA